MIAVRVVVPSTVPKLSEAMSDLSPDRSESSQPAAPKRKRYGVQGDYISLQAWVSPEAYDALRAMARRHERSLSGELRVAIARHLRDEMASGSAYRT